VRAVDLSAVRDVVHAFEHTVEHDAEHVEHDAEHIV